MLTVKCDVCNKPIDRCTATYLASLQIMEFKAECHGEVDFCQVPMNFFVYGWKIIEAVAFRRKPHSEVPILLPPPKQEDKSVISIENWTDNVEAF